jgi:hypothetical protein
MYDLTSASTDFAATWLLSSFMSSSEPRLWQSTFWQTKQVCFIKLKSPSIFSYRK